MEKIGEIIKGGLPTKSLQKYSGGTLTNKRTHFELSVFNGAAASEETKVKCVARIKAAFPQLSAEFHAILLERVKDTSMSDQRLISSVKHVIDNCEYPTPTIAQFMSYDKRVKLYTYDQIVKKNEKVSGAMKFYKTVRISGASKPMWAHVNDIELYNLERWNHE